MVEEKKNKNVICKHFPIDANNSFVQLQVSMTEAEYNELMQKDAGQAQSVSNQGKVLVQCLDRSGSMSGGPMRALKVGAQQIGQAILGADQKPFEHFITLAYDNRIETDESAELKGYE